MIERGNVREKREKREKRGREEEKTVLSSSSFPFSLSSFSAPFAFKWKTTDTDRVTERDGDSLTCFAQRCPFFSSRLLSVRLSSR
jgi:hypothetical protein